MPPSNSLPRFLRFARTLALVSAGTGLPACAAFVGPDDGAVGDARPEVIAPPPGTAPSDVLTVDLGVAVPPDVITPPPGHDTGPDVITPPPGSAPVDAGILISPDVVGFEVGPLPPPELGSERLS